MNLPKTLSDWIGSLFPEPVKGRSCWVGKDGPTALTRISTQRRRPGRSAKERPRSPGACSTWSHPVRFVRTEGPGPADDRIRLPTPGRHGRWTTQLGRAG